MIKTISKETPVTLGVVVIIIGGVVWLTNIQSKAAANSQNIVEMKSNLSQQKEDFKQAQNTTNDRLLKIVEKLSKIEGKLFKEQ